MRQLPIPSRGLKTGHRNCRRPDITIVVAQAHLRRIGARTYDQLIEALGGICGLFSADECWNYLKAAGYASD